jgi:hypothetical protein
LACPIRKRSRWTRVGGDRSASSRAQTWPPRRWQSSPPRWAPCPAYGRFPLKVDIGVSWNITCLSWLAIAQGFIFFADSNGQIKHNNAKMEWFGLEELFNCIWEVQPLPNRFNSSLNVKKLAKNEIGFVEPSSKTKQSHKVVYNQIF